MMEPRHKTKRSYRFSDATLERLDTLSKRWELDQTAVLEQLVKKAAVDEGIEKSTAKRLQAILKS